MISSKASSGAEALPQNLLIFVVPLVSVYQISIIEMLVLVKARKARVSISRAKRERNDFYRLDVKNGITLARCREEKVK